MLCFGWIVVFILLIIAIIHVRQMKIMEGAYELMIQVPLAKSVDLYNYKGQNTYLVYVLGNDVFNVAFDAGGKRLGAPTGGLAGRGDGTLSDWDKEAHFVKTLYVKK